MPHELLFPPEVFVDHLLVTIRESDMRLPGSHMPHREHARQAAALARADGQPPTLVAAALLCGMGQLLARGWARHPAADRGWSAGDAAAAHLSTYLPLEVTQPISLLSTARRYLTATEAPQAIAGDKMAEAEVQAFEADRHAPTAVALARIERRAGTGPMLAPSLESYRELLFDLCIRPLAVDSTPKPTRPDTIRPLSA